MLRSCRSCADAISLSGPRGRNERQPLLPLLPVVLMLPRESRTEAGKPRTTQQNEEHNRTSRPDGFRCSRCAGAVRQSGREERKPTRKEGTQQGKEPEQQGKEERGEAEPATTKERQRQAHKPTSPQKRGTPPYCKEQAVVPLITNSRQKISKKSPWGSFEKIFGKIFRGNVSGERKTPCVSQRKGVV